MPGIFYLEADSDNTDTSHSHVFACNLKRSNPVPSNHLIVSTFNVRTLNITALPVVRWLELLATHLNYHPDLLGLSVLAPLWVVWDLVYFDENSRMNVVTLNNTASGEYRIH